MAPRSWCDCSPGPATRSARPRRSKRLSCRSPGAPFNASILNLTVAGSGGNLKVLDAIRTNPDDRVSTARVVLCSPGGTNRLFAWESGVDGFMAGPFHVDELLAEVREVVERPESDRRTHRRIQRDRAATAAAATRRGSRRRPLSEAVAVAALAAAIIGVVTQRAAAAVVAIAVAALAALVADAGSDHQTFRNGIVVVIFLQAMLIIAAAAEHSGLLAWIATHAARLAHRPARCSSRRSPPACSSRSR